MPALVAEWQSKSYDTAKQVFLNRLYEGLRQMNTDGSFTGYSSTQDFVTALQNYMKIIRVCTNPADCFVQEFSHSSGNVVQANSLITAGALGRNDYDTDVVGIVLANGYTAMMAYNPGCSITDIGATGEQLSSCLSMVYDTNGKNSPNIMAKDIHALNTALTTQIGSLQVTLDEISFSPINTCAQSNNQGCENNYWAGAKQQCENLGMRLPAAWGELSANMAEFCKLTKWSVVSSTSSGNGYTYYGLYCPANNGAGAIYDFQRDNVGIHAFCVK
jgi:hypothetical protein